MIVHELRTPLSGIQKASELLKKPVKKTGTASKQYIDIIYQNSSGMLNLVNDILDAAKLQAGKFEITREDADVREVIDNRLEFFTLSATGRSVKLTAQVHDAVPHVAPFDVQRVKQVLNNLISNALKFTPEGGSVSVGTFVHEKDASINDEMHKAKIASADVFSDALFAPLSQSLVFTITDNGIGIEATSLPKLFSKFKQLDTSALMPNVKGTGLGLAIAKGIIEGHGGIIGVVSKVGVGSTFYFTLPCTAPGMHNE